MNTTITNDPYLKIIKFLYQFKDDNKFYKLDENVLNLESKREKYISIYNLREKALIATDSEVYFNDTDNNIVEFFNDPEGIRAKILPKGIMAAEAIL